ncbi:MAG: ABC transporter permease [Candidatus Thorarchaeota archaeon]|jgi:simple sugar transport system permease protein
MSEPIQHQVEESTEKSKIEDLFGGIVTKFTSKEFKNQIFWALGSVLLALVVAAIIMLMGGYDPGSAFLYLAVGAIGRFDQVLWYASPIIIAGLSVALAFRSGLFNIGAEGQLYIGAMASAYIAFTFSLPILLHPLLCLAVGVLAGAGWGLIPGLLKAYRGAHEVVTTMMLSYTAILFTSWLVGPNGPFWDGSMVPQSPQFYDTALLPILVGFDLHFGFIIAILAVIGVHYLINRTVLGYEMRAVGHNIDAAEYSGINSKRTVATTLAISGGLAGLAGSTEIIGTYDRFISEWSFGIGWDGITVAVLGNNNPWGVLAGGIFFGALRAGGNLMQSIARVPTEMVSVIQGLIVLFIAAPRIIEWLKDRTETIKEDAAEKPTKVVPQLLVAFFGLATVFIGLGSGRHALMSGAISPMVSISALVLMTVAVMGALLFIAEYSKDPRGSTLLLVLAVGWLEAGIVYTVGSGIIDTTSFFMASIAFVFWLMMYMIARSSTKEDDAR